MSDPTPGAAGYDVILEANVRVPMRDGLTLAADVYRPARNGVPIASRFPVLLERTPYGKHLPSRSERSVAEPEPAKSRAEVAAMFVQHGYVVVYQDCRGRYESEGRFRKYIDDARDGVDTCVWLLQQAWCNGQIGTMGLSYAAHTQAALASLGAPGVRAMILDSGGFANAYQGGIRRGGAFELKQVTWAYRNSFDSPTIQNNPRLRAELEAVDLRDWFTRMPWRRGYSPLSRVPAYEDYLFEQWERGVFDEYWQQPGLYAQGFHDRFPDCPQIHMSSWYDPYSRTAIENYLGLSARKRGPIHLILGPWTHGDRSLTYAGEVDFGPAATLDNNLASDWWQMRRHFFDRWLRGQIDGADESKTMPPVQIFVMGGGSGRRNEAGRVEHGGQWREARTWPLPETRFTPFYLHRDGGLRTTSPSRAAAPLGFRYDPRRPVPTIGGAVTSGAPLMLGGPFDQREGPAVFGAVPPYRALAERGDVLVFQTEVLSEPLEVTGPIVARLWVASDCPDTDITAKLIDVYPPTPDDPQGFAMNLCDGILRLRYRDSWTEPRFMSADQIYPVEVVLLPTSNLFQAGHRLRLDISSSNFPQFDLNFNTGEPEGAATHVRVAHNRIFVDAEHPSHVLLPLI